MTSKSKNRETVGAKSLELSLKKPETTSPIEQMRENNTDFEKNVQECIEVNSKKYRGDFYAVVLTKKERLMQNVIRNLYLARQSCPTPDYDQVVYRYHSGTGTIEFMWVVPSKDTCELYLANRLRIAANELELLSFIVRFDDGSLLGLSKKLNKEKKDSNIIER